ncbi:hypothetical protein [Chitinophaga ginsengisegetis]|uniref:hypothetical protein n=1 Tax=Chitinophaga ginsengisegetis TaxID=393003 RepID=UPI000DB9121C|nr:hypothetical protein [Chitinophaga ginsengisegetis]MDR6570744.1 hypothetical protein [Chitinophaga ginsengisegetis]MDR6650478.1 hypothetical protein [Chitinophaga ginsengisegetis]MDR6656883.1 hypothetical protein [Chitinophaga ginsengisegetis]
MKRLLSLLLLLPVADLYAQSPDTILINYQDLPKSKIKRRVSHGNMVVLEIININKSRYNIQVNNTSTNFFLQQPEILSKLDGSSLELNTSEDPKPPAGPAFSFNDGALKLKALWQAELTPFKASYKKLNDKLDNYWESLKKFKKAVEVLQHSLYYKNELIAIKDACDGTYPQAEKNLLAATTTFVNNNKIGEETAAASKELLLAQVTNILDHYTQVATTEKATLEQLVKEINEAAKPFKEDADKLMAKLLTVKKTAKADDFTNDNLILDKAIRVTNERVETMQSNEEAVKKGIEIIDSYKLLDQKNLIVNSYKVINPVNYTIRQAAIADKDELKFDIKIEPKDNTICADPGIQTPIIVRTYGGFKLDFSTGFFLNFGNNNFFDQSYRLDSISGDPDNVKIEKNDNRNKVVPALGALMHAYYRTGWDFQPALAVGVSLSTGSTTKFNYHLGVSAAIGREQRFIASFGWTLTQATLLSSKYQEGQIVPKATMGTTVETESFYKWGNFLAITYNLTR